MDILHSKSLREKREPIGLAIRQMAEKANKENRDFNAEEKPQWEKANKDYNDLTRQIEIAECAEKVVVESAKPAGDNRVGRDDYDGSKRAKAEDRDNHPATEEDRALVLQAWVRKQHRKGLRPQHKEACRKLRFDPRTPEFPIQLRTGDYRQVRKEVRDLSVVTGSAGQFTIPQGFVQNIERSLLAFGGMREVADVMRTASGNDLPWPTSDDTSNKGAILAENTVVSEQDVVFAQITFKAYKYTSKMIQVPVELMEDSAFNLAEFLGTVLGERVARILNEHFTTGTGSGQPNGFITAASQGVLAASATAIAPDELFDLLHSVNPAYRPGARFMMHDNVLLKIRKLKDTQNRYLWQESMRVGEPEQLLGYPITVNQDMASSLAINNKTVAFGQFTKYKIRDVAQARLRRLEERYADADQIAFVLFSRHDGRTLDAGTDPIKYLQQAAA